MGAEWRSLTEPVRRDGARERGISSFSLDTLGLIVNRAAF